MRRTNRTLGGVRALGAAAIAVTFAITVDAQQPQNIGVAPVVLRAEPYTFDTAEQHGIKVSIVARGLAHPFSVAFLPNGDALVTERGQRLRLVHGAASGKGAASLDPEPIAGVPEPGAFRGAGIAEVALHPKFAENHWLYFTYNTHGAEIKDSGPPGRHEAAVALGRGKLEGKKLTGVQELFTGEWENGNSGSRLAFGTDGLLYMTTGAPFDQSAQDLRNVYGKVLRLRDDGKPAPDNPFVGKPGARPEIFKLGHRDQLGLTVHAATGSVLNAEHGPNGGDEVNLLLPGRNYGWPKFSFGRNYDGPRISPAPLGEGIEQPLILWLPSIAPTGLTFYTGDRFPAWKGNLFVGSARVGEIPRTGALERVVVNDRLEELRRERLLGDLHQRIRDVRQGPDGLLYVLTDEHDGAPRRAVHTGGTLDDRQEGIGGGSRRSRARYVYRARAETGGQHELLRDELEPEGRQPRRLGRRGRGLSVARAGGRRGREDLACVPEHEHRRREDADRQRPVVQLQGRPDRPERRGSPYARQEQDLGQDFPHGEGHDAELPLDQRQGRSAASDWGLAARHPDRYERGRHEERGYMQGLDGRRRQREGDARSCGSPRAQRGPELVERDSPVAGLRHGTAQADRRRGPALLLRDELTR